MRSLLVSGSSISRNSRGCDYKRGEGGTPLLDQGDMMREENAVKVHPSRLARSWDGCDAIDGDIVRTYSADLISESKKIRGVFEWQGRAFVCVSVFHQKDGVKWCEAVEVVPVGLFKPERDSLEEAGKPGDCFYYGTQVKKGKEAVVLGEALTFIPDQSCDWAGPEKQQELF